MYAHAQAPVRIGIAGGGTDLPAWTRERVGHCLSLAVRSHTHAVAISRPDGQVVASYRKRDVSTSATEIANGLVRESALLHGWEEGFEVHTISELTSRGSGLGVSSSIAVSLAACFQRLARLRDGVTAEPRWQDGGEPAYRMAVARDAWTVEIERLRRPIGRQDHMAAAHGGLRLYSFFKDDAAVERTFSREDAEWVAKHLVLVQLPDGHDSRAILQGVKSSAPLEYAAMAVSDAVKAIETRSVQLLGRALATGQASKSAIPGATPSAVADVLARLKALSTVHGCKVAGAGGGGHVVVAISSGLGVLRQIEHAINLPVLAVVPDHDGVRSDGWA